jgi:hypothetical protein
MNKDDGLCIGTSSIFLTHDLFLRHSGTKQSILFSREHTVKESMQHVKMWNSAYLQGEDLQEAMRAVLSKDTPKFTKN